MAESAPPSVGVESASRHVERLIQAARALSPADRMALLSGLGGSSRVLASGATKFSVVVKLEEPPRSINRAAIRRVKNMKTDYFPGLSDSPSQPRT
ncbi:MAG: hypothetical protein AAGD32_15480 [Planctomycetota bacterium]